jgi:hypothetical protein
VSRTWHVNAISNGRIVGDETVHPFGKQAEAAARAALAAAK